MTDPISLDALLNDYPTDYEAWVLQDKRSGKYVTIPDEARYPGRRIFRFFMSEKDALRVRDEIIASGNKKIAEAEIQAVRVPLHRAMKSISTQPTDGFVMHSPNEVFENFGTR
jgi:hypothetical protein